MSIEAARLSVHVGADTGEAEAGLDRVNKKVGLTAGSAGIAGAALTAGITVPLLKMGGAALGTAMDYQASMNLFQAVSGATAEEMAAVSQKAKDLGADMTLPATSAADAGLAMTELAKAGLSVNDVLAASKGVLAMSAAGQLSNAAAAEITANALNAFNLEGESAIGIADLFAAAANTSSAEVSDVGDAFKMSASVFAKSGQTVAGLTNSIALMSNAGIQGSDAGTSLKQMILSLQAPTAKSRDLMADLGVSVYDSAGNMLPMRGIVDQFSTKLSGLTQEQRNAALATIFGSDAVRAANVVLMGGVESWDEMRHAIGRDNAAAELAGAQMKGLKGILAGIQSQVETAGLVLMERFLPPLEALGLKVAAAVDWFMKLDPNIQNAALAFLAVAAAVGPLLLTFGGLAMVVGTALGPILLVTAAVGLLAAAFAGNLFGVRDIVAGVVATISEKIGQIGNVVGAIVGIFDGAMLAPIRLVMALSDLFGISSEQSTEWSRVIMGAVQFVQDLFAIGIPAALATLQGIWATIWPQILSIATMVWRNVERVIRVVIEEVVPLIITMFGSVVTWVQANWPTIQGVIETVWNGIRQIIAIVLGEIVPKIIEGFGVVFGWVQENWPRIQAIIETVWNAILAVVNTVITHVVPFVIAEFSKISAWVDENWPLIQQTIETVLNAILRIVEKVVGWITDFWTKNHDDILEVAERIWDIIKTAIDTAINLILGIIKSAMQAINGDWEGAWETIKGVADKAWEAIKRIVEDALAIVKTIVGDKLNELIAAIRGKADELVSAGAALIQGLIDGIAGAAQGVIDAVTGVVNDAISAAKRLLGIESPSKVFKEIGRQVVSGLTIGINVEQESPIRAIEQIIERLLRESTEKLGALGEALMGIGEGLAAVMAALLSVGGYESGKLREVWGRLTDDLEFIVAGLQALAEFYARASSPSLASAKAVSDAIKPAVDAIASIVDALTAVNTYEAAANMPARWAALEANLSAAIAALGRIAANFSTAALDAARDFAAGAGEVVSILGTAVSNLMAVGEFEDVANFGAKIARLADMLGVAVLELARVRGWRESIKDWAAAAEWATAVKPAIDIIASGVAAINSIIDLKAQVGTFGERMARFADMLGQAVVEILRVRGWRESMDTWIEAGDWALAVEPAIRLIADGVAAVNSVAALVVQEGSFGRNVTRLASMLGTAVLAMVDVRNWRESIDAWAAASEWAVAVGPAVNLIAGAVEAVSSLASLPAMVDFPARIARFKDYLGQALTALIEIATGTPAALWTAAQTFAEKVGGAVGLIATAVDALTRLAEWGTEFLTPVKIDTFMDVLRYTAEMFGWVSYQVSPYLLAAAQQFALDTEGVFAAMSEALQFLSDLAAAALPAEGKIDAFIATLRRIFDQLAGGVLTSAGIAMNAGAIAGNLASIGLDVGMTGKPGTARVSVPLAPHPQPYMPWDVPGRPARPGGGGGGGGGSSSDSRLAELLTQIRDVTVEIAEKMGITPEDFTTSDLLNKLAAVRA